jgi:hypothetical protein
LGIDLGSTSTRAYIRCVETAEYHYVHNPNRNNLSSRYEFGDFSSLGYPFDDGPVYLGEDHDPSRLSISLKYGFYILAKCPNDIRHQYAVVEPLLDKANDYHFRFRLKHGLVSLFRTIQSIVNEICDENSIVIETIAATIPAQWTLEFEAVYRDILSQAFNLPEPKISFVAEVEALIHTLLNDHVKKLALNQYPKASSYLFLDLGGHTMVRLSRYTTVTSSDH